MFEITLVEDGAVRLSGRLDAAQARKAEAFFDDLSGARRVDLGELDYISSAGLAVLLKTQKRLLAGGGGLKLANVNHHIMDILHYSGFDAVFEIEPPVDK